MKIPGAKDFRDLVEEVSMLMAYEVTRNLPAQKMYLLSRPLCALRKVKDDFR
jgi:uracil phosphoribosyltransferase